MPFMVIYRTSDGSSCYEQADAIDEAALFVERLRNKEGIDEIRIYRMEEISFAFRPYYKVELGLPERQSAPPSAVTTAALAEPPAPDPVRRRPSTEDDADALPTTHRGRRAASRHRRGRGRAAGRPAAARPRGRDRRRQRPPGAVRPLTPAGRRLIPARWSNSAASASADRPTTAAARRRPAPRARTRRPTAARSRSHHGRRSCVGDLGHLHQSTVLLPRDLSRGRLHDHAVRRCYRWPRPRPRPRRTRLATGGRAARRRWIALVVALVLLVSAVIGAASCRCRTWRCGPGRSAR